MIKTRRGPAAFAAVAAVALSACACAALAEEPANFAAALEQANRLGQPVVIDFFTSW